jgi:hypothetical protein
MTNIMRLRATNGVPLTNESHYCTKWLVATNDYNLKLIQKHIPWSRCTMKTIAAVVKLFGKFSPVAIRPMAINIVTSAKIPEQ